MHDLNAMWKVDEKLRKALGKEALLKLAIFSVSQLLIGMAIRTNCRLHMAHKTKLGFLTTYNATIFLKQDMDAKGKWNLWYSNVVLHDISPRPVFSLRDPSSYWKDISVQVCFLYLSQQIILQQHKANNTTNIEEWVGNNEDMPEGDLHCRV